MKEITYTYEIISKDDTQKTFQVRYESAGRESVTKTLDYPFVNDIDLDLLIQRYSPVVEWVNAERTRIEVNVGLSHTITAHFPDFE